MLFCVVSHCWKVLVGWLYDIVGMLESFEIVRGMMLRI